MNSRFETLATSYLCVPNTWAGGILRELAGILADGCFIPRCIFRWQDIVIGAPQYFDRDGEVGGAVYVYINQQGRWNNVKPIRLNGTKDSMFGIAVKNIGDINQDGYQGR